MARATLAPRPGMVAPVPPLRKRPLATMKDMGMDMSSMDMGGGGDQTGHAGMSGMSGMADSAKPGMAMPMSRGVDPTVEKNASALLGAATAAMPGMDHGKMDHSAMSTSPGHGSMDMGGMKMRDLSYAPEVRKGPGVQTISAMPMDRTGEPGQGLEDVGHRVLVYKDLMARERNPDVRAPSRSLDIHLTGNMDRFMWAFDGVKMSDTMDPYPFIEGERVRINLINDTMMAHPIHIHGHFFELVTGHGDHAPRKHTVIVQPGGKVTWDFTADAVGDWAFHCHLLYHMVTGMMRVVSVRPRGDGA
jgi:FtsP/CotA-like multicopper oxidase with cupredoxin domain